nr:hypothetical protein [Tanacetum cinerariifolium]
MFQVINQQQDVITVGQENRPAMLSRDTYIQWKTRMLRYLKTKHNGHLLVDSVLNGPYKFREIREPGDPQAEIPVATHMQMQTYTDLSDTEKAQVAADDMAIHLVLLGLPNDVFVTVDALKSAYEV